MTFIFNTSREYPRMHVCYKFGDSNPNLGRLTTDKPNFLEFWVKMAKLTLKVKVNDPHFQYQLRVSHAACLVQISLFKLKSVTSYCTDKAKLTDGRIDRRTNAGNHNTPSAWMGKG